MKGRPVDQLVYETLFPKPKATDPPNFHALLQRQLVQEVRSETASFYGSLESREAQYPGLDYSYQPHRMRLSRFTWHRRLFRAFDALKLTPSEIAGLTKWEGTKWAKERFEKESGMIIRDTTGDCIHDWVQPELRSSNRTFEEAQQVVLDDMEDIEHEVEDMDEGDDSDIEIESVGVELNERLRAAVAEREAGNAATVMDEEWEQWLKEAAEAGGIPFLSDQTFQFSDNDDTADPSSSATAMPPRLLNAARLGQWSQIPDFLQNMVRQNIEENNRTGTVQPTRQTFQDTPRSAHSIRRPIADSHEERAVRPFTTSPLIQQDSQNSARPIRRPISNPGLGNEIAVLRSTTALGSSRRVGLTRSFQPSPPNFVRGGNARRSQPSSSALEQPRPRS